MDQQDKENLASGLSPLRRAAQALGLAVAAPRACFFTFHRAAPSSLWDALPNRNFYLELDYLARLLAWLRAGGWEIVTVEEALCRIGAGERGAKLVNFSVDDCYRDTFEQVAPLFRKFQAPVTLFLTTGIPDGDMPLWGAGLEDILRARDSVVCDGHRMNVETPEAKRAAFAALQRQWDGPDAGAHYDAFCRANGTDAEELHWRHAITWEMLEALRDDPFVEIGGHTVTHARISALSEDEARAELAGCRARIGERLGLDARHFAFPYGRAADAGPRDFRLAQQAGWSSAATTRKGIFRGGDRFSLPRNTLNGAARNLAMAQAHLMGLTGLAASALGRV